MEENGWYHTGVDFMVKNGFMNGVADDAFDVDGNLTRAQLVTILYRIAGEPESTATNPFADVADGQWYTNAVIWAAENGIVKGVNTTTFAPNDQITREQIATILFRYAKAEKVEGKLAGFPDAEKVSDYAADAMAWAVEQGLINGISESDGKTYLAPQETATRAQIAVILMRYLTAENGSKKIPVRRCGQGRSRPPGGSFLTFAARCRSYPYCRGAACRSRRCTDDLHRLSLKRRWLPICHCEGALRPWQSRGGSCNFAGSVLLSGRVLRDCHVASLLAMTHQEAWRRKRYTAPNWCCFCRFAHGRGMPRPYHE